MLLALFYLALVYSSIFISQADLIVLVNFPVIEYTNYLRVLPIFHDSVTLWFIVDPFSIIVESILIGLILAATVS